jgi:hypothetical protein
VCPTHRTEPHPRNISSLGLDLDTTTALKGECNSGEAFFLILKLEVVGCRGEENAERVKGK